MNDFLLYLLKVSAGIAIIYIVYLTIFSRDTFYFRNRIILILALLLPPVFPLLKIPVKAPIAVEKIPIDSIDSVITNSIVTISSPGNTFDYNLLVIWIYFIISGLLLLRIFISLVSTYRIIKKGEIVDGQFPKVVVSELPQPPFSFFPYAVIPAQVYKNGDYSEILDHEFAHIKQGHTFDLLLCELFIAFQWFNPISWFIKRSIILNHEYLADHISLRNNKNVLEYQYRLLNFQSGLKHVSLAHNFNSLIKNRIIMINKKRTRKYAALKNILILPLVAIVAYSFATPEYRYSDAKPNDNTISINQPLSILQKEVKGIVVDENDKPFEGVIVMSTGTIGNAYGATTDKNGRFSIINVQEDASLLFSSRGYKGLSVKPDFKQEMSVKMEKDPEYKEASSEYQDTIPEQLVVVDRVVTELKPDELFSKMGSELATVKNLQGKEATDKYGEAGRNGVLEIYTVKGAKEFGIIVPFIRRTPDDFPTFQGEKPYRYTNWLIDNMQYPAEATSKGIQGRVTVKFTVEADGSIDNIVLVGNVNPLLGETVVKAIKASPKWEPAKNPEARQAYEQDVNLKFELPGRIYNSEAFVVVEEMPRYPGGEEALVNFLTANTNYPEAVRKEKIEGKVIVRFIVGASGDAEEAVVLRGVHPLLDEEALRVVNLLKGFIPGKQGGEAVEVYYMVPVTFSLPTADLSR